VSQERLAVLYLDEKRRQKSIAKKAQEQEARVMEQCTFKPKLNKKKSESALTSKDLPRLLQPEQKAVLNQYGPSNHPLDKKIQEELLTSKGMLVPKSMVNLS
jgi:hypothetical protein